MAATPSALLFILLHLEAAAKKSEVRQCMSDWLVAGHAALRCSTFFSCTPETRIALSIGIGLAGYELVQPLAGCMRPIKRGQGRLLGSAKPEGPVPWHGHPEFGLQLHAITALVSQALFLRLYRHCTAQTIVQQIKCPTRIHNALSPSDFGGTNTLAFQWRRGKRVLEFLIRSALYCNLISGYNYRVLPFAS